MVLMAIDHSSALIARVHFTEIWGVDFTPYPNLAWWFTRFVSHLCAPGFFFLMGMSMMLFVHNRKQKEWPDKDIRNYFFKRGGLILLMMLFLEIPAWGLGSFFSQVHNTAPFPGGGFGGFFIPTTVLYGLGMCMITGAMLWQLKNSYFLVISALCFALSHFYISNADPHTSFHPLLHLLLVPGASPGAMSIYPVIPWLGVMTFGMFCGNILLRRQSEEFHRFAFYTGWGLVLAFFVLRFMKAGNFHLVYFDDWISFFTLIKYPPSLTFILITIGINLILLYVFSKFNTQNNSLLEPLKLFGQTAMFFYIVHLYIYALIGALFPEGTHIALMYVLWLVGLYFLYYQCRWFLEFKQSKPKDSWWRMV